MENKTYDLEAALKYIHSSLHPLPSSDEPSDEEGVDSAESTISTKSTLSKKRVRPTGSKNGISKKVKKLSTNTDNLSLKIFFSPSNSAEKRSSEMKT